MERRAPRRELGDYAGPTAMRTEMKVVDSFIDALNKDVTVQLIGTGKHGQWVSRFRGFRREWRAWHDRNKGLLGSWFPGLTGSMVTLAQFRKRAEAWRKEFEGLGGKPVGPGMPPSVAKPSEPGDLWRRARPWIIAGGILYGVGLLAPVVTGLVKGRAK